VREARSHGRVPSNHITITGGGRVSEPSTVLHDRQPEEGSGTMLEGIALTTTLPHASTALPAPGRPPAVGDDVARHKRMPCGTEDFHSVHRRNRVHAGQRVLALCLQTEMVDPHAKTMRTGVPGNARTSTGSTVMAKMTYNFIRRNVAMNKGPGESMRPHDDCAVRTVETDAAVAIGMGCVQPDVAAVRIIRCMATHLRLEPADIRACKGTASQRSESRPANHAPARLVHTLAHEISPYPLHDCTGAPS
jgi:hypothetical protein